MSEDRLLAVLQDLRNWTRAASYVSVKSLLLEALPDAKARTAYQMMDGSTTQEQIRVACKLSPNAIVLLAQRCTAMSLMELREDKKRARLFDLNDFALLDIAFKSETGTKE